MHTSYDIPLPFYETPNSIVYNPYHYPYLHPYLYPYLLLKQKKHPENIRDENGMKTGCFRDAFGTLSQTSKWRPVLIHLNIYLVLMVGFFFYPQADIPSDVLKPLDGHAQMIGPLTK